jgi:choline dehydrogenase-like flavoprotein
MKKYDLVIIGSGSGAIVMEEAVAHGLKVALVDRGSLGGSCLNLGCIPSKMILYPADRVVGTILPIANAMHIHSALSEVVQATLGNLNPVIDIGDP